MYCNVFALVLAAASIAGASPALEARQTPPTCAATVCSFTGTLTLPGGLTLPNITLNPDEACVGCADTACLPLNATHLDTLGGGFEGDISTCQTTAAPAASAA
ncbi:uncharacterized protein PHACADRAFT_203628 [Phanerochaete carnosa HHB-10118-sp]|uniref:Hydrophobin n=1 Tax=Phanerochaete carnosa (strain HHB-10118-sp) TaxID=650164 RepID=K5W916_PHACS|nr:uncharacterized protein PHACADRAFT_203628 [Phanerochaete carnosa HHB-10118-sp]EKM60423.1 hypothetical protein PHACADRAFT_203628 [Phanerochaete carnosa HHB-10118-sp]